MFCNLKLDCLNLSNNFQEINKNEYIEYLQHVYRGL